MSDLRGAVRSHGIAKLVAILLVLTITLMIGCVRSDKAINLMLPYAPDRIPEQIRGPRLAATTRPHFGVDPMDSGGFLAVQGDVLPIPDGRFFFAGHISLSIGRQSYIFGITEPPVLSRVRLTSGREVVFGILRGQITTMSGPTIANLIIAAEPGTPRGEVSLGVGTIPYDAVLYFGEKVLSENEMKELLRL